LFSSVPPFPLRLQYCTVPAVDVASIRQDLMAMADAAIRAVHAGALLEAALSRPPTGFRVDQPTTVVAAGKASRSMVETYLHFAGDACRQGMVAAPGERPPAIPDRIRWFNAGHPVPTSASVDAGAFALTLARGAAPDSQFVVLLSGGASALLALPLAGLTLDDKQRVTSALLAAGARIDELNCVRKHLSGVKGGRLAAACRANAFTFAVSDVVNPVDDDPAVIGSGPTVADPSTYKDALNILDRLGVESSIPVAARNILERGARGEIEESPKPGDARVRGEYRIIGSRRTAMAAVRAEAERRGYKVIVEEAAIVGEARDAGPRLIGRALDYGRSAERVCVIASGETTVKVTGTGKGGRNQELVLAALPDVASAPRSVFFASVASDGVDGPTDAAGAWAGPDVTSRANAAGLNAIRSLENNDAYRFFEPLGNLIRTGWTDTNVGDLQIVVMP
jgi:glycerate 2-kinase